MIYGDKIPREIISSVTLSGSTNCDNIASSSFDASGK